MKFKPWYLVLPAVLLLFAIDIVPFLWSIYYSTFRYIIISKEPISYISFGNYVNLVNDPSFLSSLKTTFFFSIVSVAIQIPLGYLIANVLSSEFRGRNVIRLLYVLPLALSPIAIGAMWKIMMTPTFGPVPFIFSEMGMMLDYSASPLQSFLLTVLVDTWQWTPFVSLVLLAGLTGIPKTIIEGGVIDGAGGWKKHRYIIIPLITSEILLVVLMRFMDTFKIFDVVWMLTRGGPGTSTKYVSINIVLTTILYGWDMGYGAAMSLALLFIIIVLSFVLNKFLTRR